MFRVPSERSASKGRTGKEGPGCWGKRGRAGNRETRSRVNKLPLHFHQLERGKLNILKANQISRGEAMVGCRGGGYAHAEEVENFKPVEMRTLDRQRRKTPDGRTNFSRHCILRSDLRDKKLDRNHRINGEGLGREGDA